MNGKERGTQPNAGRGKRETPDVLPEIRAPSFASLVTTRHPGGGSAENQPCRVASTAASQVQPASWSLRTCHSATPPLDSVLLRRPAALYMVPGPGFAHVHRSLPSTAAVPHSAIADQHAAQQTQSGQRSLQPCNTNAGCTRRSTAHHLVQLSCCGRSTTTSLRRGHRSSTCVECTSGWLATRQD